MSLSSLSIWNVFIFPLFLKVFSAQRILCCLFFVFVFFSFFSCFSVVVFSFIISGGTLSPCVKYFFSVFNILSLDFSSLTICPNVWYCSYLSFLGFAEFPRLLSWFHLSGLENSQPLYLQTFLLLCSVFYFWNCHYVPLVFSYRSGVLCSIFSHSFPLCVSVWVISHAYY